VVSGDRPTGSPYAFHLIAEGLTVCPFSGSFLRLTVLPLQGFEVTHPIFVNSIDGVAWSVGLSRSWPLQKPA